MTAPTATPLAGRRAVVTGAGSGIGRAAAEMLARQGAAVAAVDLRRDALDEVCAAIVGDGGRAAALVADVADETAMATAVGAAADALGGLDTVVACAGITMAARTDELSLASWEQMLRVNLTGMFLTVRPALPHLVTSGDGSIVTVGSVASLVAAGRCSAYDAAKGGVLQFTKAVAAEYAHRGVRANCVCPGRVSTGLAQNSQALYDVATANAGGYRGPSERVDPPVGRAAHPAEIAAAIAWLCSSTASFVTGVALPVDGGYTVV